MRKLYLWCAAIAIVTYLGATFIHAAYPNAVPGNVTEPAPDWKLRVTVTSPDNKVFQVLVKQDEHTGKVQLWPSLKECEAYMDTDDYKNSLPALADYLRGHGLAEASLAVQCVPEPKPDSI